MRCYLLPCMFEHSSSLEFGSFITLERLDLIHSCISPVHILIPYILFNTLSYYLNLGLANSAFPLVLKVRFFSCTTCCKDLILSLIIIIRCFLKKKICYHWYYIRFTFMKCLILLSSRDSLPGKGFYALQVNVWIVC